MLLAEPTKPTIDIVAVRVQVSELKRRWTDFCLVAFLAKPNHVLTKARKSVAHTNQKLEAVFCDAQLAQRMLLILEVEDAKLVLRAFHESFDLIFADLTIYELWKTGIPRRGRVRSTMVDCGRQRSA